MRSTGPTTCHHLTPPFPSDIPTAPLVSISLAKLESGDEEESNAFFGACKNLGFFYMNTEGSELGNNLIFEAEQLHEEKEEYAREKIDPFFGYKHGELKIKAQDGRPKRNETYNMRKDDIVGNCDPLPSHPLVKENQALLKNYVYHCRAAIDLMISHLERHLRLPSGALAKLYRIEERSGDHVRFQHAAIQPYSDEMAKQGEHTDFGTLTILFNWLGGLQVRCPGTEDWVYVKPIPGSAVVNLGDALVKFTAGILRSNIHRVVPPPPPQYGQQRNSLVYFSRPEDRVVLRRLEGGLIDRQPRAEKQEPELTAQEWTLRRSVGDLKGVYTYNGGLELRREQ
ncbi:hypothetical protein C8J57DRAFT_1376794 [Mycena rebaudengoi]|nr:hypothetical protein C8J57DRAFT_1376794 [Mycena rebaudengoi]